MDIGKLASDDFTVQVPFGDGPDPATITIRYAARDKFAELVAKATKITYNPKTHQREEKVDNAEANRLVGEWAVTGWKGITQDGADYPFTPENRDLLMARWHEFAKFVLDVCTDLQALVASEREAVRGN